MTKTPRTMSIHPARLQPLPKKRRVVVGTKWNGFGTFFCIYCVHNRRTIYRDRAKCRRGQVEARPHVALPSFFNTRRKKSRVQSQFSLWIWSMHQNVKKYTTLVSLIMDYGGGGIARRVSAPYNACQQQWSKNYTTTAATSVAKARTIVSG